MRRIDHKFSCCRKVTAKNPKPIILHCTTAECQYRCFGTTMVRMACTTAFWNAAIIRRIDDTALDLSNTESHNQVNKTEITKMERQTTKVCYLFAFNFDISTLLYMISMIEDHKLLTEITAA
ncbi:Acetylglutamate kinase [Dirofilaria immitis]